MNKTRMIIWTTLPAIFNKALAEERKISATINLKILGEGGGCWAIEVFKDELFIAEREDKKPITPSVMIKVADFLSIGNGDTALSDAMATGMIEIKGDMKTVIDLLQLFDFSKITSILEGAVAEK